MRRPLLALVALIATTLLWLPASAASLTVASGSLDPWRTCVLNGVSASSTPVAETFVNQASPTASSGNVTTMDVRSSANANRRAYIRFDLTQCPPQVPPTANVVAASLDLFVTQVAAACRTIDVFPVPASWVETSVTWSNQPFGTAINNPASAARTASTTIGASPCTITSTNVYASWDVTSDVAGWITTGATQYGWMLRDDVEGSATARNTRFSTSEANNAARAPRLTVTYRP